MGNIRVQKPDGDFEMIPGTIIRNMDVLTIGLYAKLLTFGEQWDLNIRALAAELGLSIDKTRAGVTLLEKEGFIRREVRRSEDGKVLSGWEYIILGVQAAIEDRTKAGISVSQNQTSLISDKSENDKDCPSSPLCSPSSFSPEPPISTTPIIPTTPQKDSHTPPSCECSNSRIIDNSQVTTNTPSPRGESYADLAQKVYDAYPARDVPTADYPKGRSLSKCGADKEKIAKLLKEGKYTVEYLIAVIKQEIVEHPNGYMKNFSTFLNHIPEYIPKDPKEEERERKEREREAWLSHGARLDDMPRWMKKERGLI